MTSTFNETFMFLTKLAWNCKITLPILVTAVFLALDFRMQIELNVETDQIVFQVNWLRRGHSHWVEGTNDIESLQDEIDYDSDDEDDDEVTDDSDSSYPNAEEMYQDDYYYIFDESAAANQRAHSDEGHSNELFSC